MPTKRPSTDADATPWKKAHTEEDFDEYKRPPVVEEPDGSIIFQMIDADYASAPPNPEYSATQLGKPPVVRFFGLNKHGNSVTCHIHEFLPYFYVKPSRDLTESECHSIKESLEDRLASEITVQGKSPQYVMAVEPVQKMSIMYYTESTEQFLKITLLVPKHVPCARKIFENGGLTVYGIDHVSFSTTTYESALPFVNRLMTDTDTACGQWIRLAPGNYSHRGSYNKLSTSQIEVDTSYRHLEPLQFTGEYNSIAPYRTFSFDIECTHRKGIFPEASQDAVVCLSATIDEYGHPDRAKKIRFHFKEATPTTGVDVRCYDTEEEMLMAISKFIVDCDPDVFTGWNINSFDTPYLLDRAEALKLKEFKKFSRLKDTKVVAMSDTFESNAYGKRESKKIMMPGRVHRDQMVATMRGQRKFRSYGLNAIADAILGQKKNDFDSRKIPDFFDGPSASASTRGVFGEYCDKDAELPLKISQKQMTFPQDIEMVRVTKVTMNVLLFQGQQVKVMAQIHRFANPRGYIIPVTPESEKQKGSGDDVAYEGAIVIPPERGLYDTSKPIATLDFSSLYPSIMMANNLCYSTLIPPNRVHLYPPEIYHKTPYNDSVFVLPEKKKGILTQILEEIIRNRKNAKDELAKETDEGVKAVLDGRQLALKVSANSVYGFTGALVGRLPCLEISASVTAYGRQMIMMTKNFILTHYTTANGYEHNAEVIYGDTDSVMVRFGTSDIKEAMRLGKDACKKITERLFKKPVKLEFEKVYSPYLLINKKRYAGLKWEEDSKSETGLKSKLDVKGMESVRRDSCPMVKEIIESVLKMLIIENNRDKAFQHCVDQVGKLFRGEIDTSKLVITKAISKSEKEYANKQVHIESVKRMQERDSSVQMVLGDRPPYVMVRNSMKGTKNFEKSEDPIYVITNNVPIDYPWYLTNQLQKPLTRVFEYIKGVDLNQIFHGQHTKQMHISEMKEDPKKNTITKLFAKRKYHCLACNVTVADQKTAVCPNCTSEVDRIREEKTKRMITAVDRRDELWKECSDCQAKAGNLQQPEDCVNSACSIFYARLTARNEAKAAEELIKRFDW